MIIGNGLLAKAFSASFADASATLIFASGVSDSTSTVESEFERERTLLSDALARHAGRFVYFSSCAASATSGALSPYLAHKQRMESLVLASADPIVLRLPQVVGRTGNPHTLTNFLRDCIIQGTPFTIWKNAERNLIDVDDVYAIGAELIRTTHSADRVFSIAAPKSLLMPTIVEIFEKVLARKANYSVEERGSPMDIDTTASNAVATALGIRFDADYSERVVRKYYAA